MPRDDADDDTGSNDHTPGDTGPEPAAEPPADAGPPEAAEIRLPREVQEAWEATCRMLARRGAPALSDSVRSVLVRLPPSTADHLLRRSGRHGLADPSGWLNYTARLYLRCPQLRQADAMNYYQGLFPASLHAEPEATESPPRTPFLTRCPRCGLYVRTTKIEGPNLAIVTSPTGFHAGAMFGSPTTGILLAAHSRGGGCTAQVRAIVHDCNPGGTMHLTINTPQAPYELDLVNPAPRGNDIQALRCMACGNAYSPWNTTPVGVFIHAVTFACRSCLLSGSGFALAVPAVNPGSNKEFLFSLTALGTEDVLRPFVRAREERG